MSLLSEAELVALQNTPPVTCRGCLAEVRYNYCETCDLYFTMGHQTDCPTLNEGHGYSNNHAGHIVQCEM